jgi:hypothetical protein
MRKHTIGIDVGTSHAKSAVQLLTIEDDNSYCRERVNWIRVAGALVNNPTSPVMPIIEWVEVKAGAYTPHKSRVADMLRTHSTGTSMRDAFLHRGRTVCCVPRNVILQQAGWNRKQKADEFVLRYLEVLGYLKTAKRVRKKDLKEYFVCTTKGLTKTHDRDALMCALFNWSDPRNKRYLVAPDQLGRL